MIPRNTVSAASLVAFPVFVAGTILLAVLFRDELWQVFASPERLKSWVDGWGPVAPLVFIGLQFVQVVVFVIPGEIPQIAGGYLFGVPLGISYSLIGIGSGSLFNFFIARTLGVPFTERILGRKRLLRFSRFIDSPRTLITFLLLFLIPGIPKDILCYVSGLSSMSITAFLAVSMIGRVPGILLSVLFGDAAAGGRWIPAAIIALSAGLLFLAGLIFREWIQLLIGRQASSRRAEQTGRGPDQAARSADRRLPVESRDG